MLPSFFYFLKERLSALTFPQNWTFVNPADKVYLALLIKK